MKRFIADGVLILILLVLGSSISKEDLYVNKQEELKQFEQHIENNKVVEDKESVYVMNQIEENKASTMAKGVSKIVTEIFRIGILVLNSIFDSLTKT